MCLNSYGLELQERHRRDGPSKTLQDQISHHLRLHDVLDRRHYALGGEHLPRPRLAAQTEREVRHAPDRPVVPASLEADRADGGEPFREAEADVQLVAALPPSGRELG